MVSFWATISIKLYLHYKEVLLKVIRLNKVQTRTWYKRDDILLHIIQISGTIVKTVSKSKINRMNRFPIS